jgi:hypothetical protein
VIGLFSFLTLIGMMINNFKTKASVEDEMSLVQPASGKLIVKVAPEKVSYYGGDWFGFNWDEDAPFYGMREDSVMMTTVRVNLVKSADSEYHLGLVRFSRGSNPALAKDMASRIQFTPRQSDSVLFLPRGFAITREEKFRNQQVLVIVSVPVGKRILVDPSVDDYHFFSINVNRRHQGWNVEWNDDWDGSLQWSSNVEYTMTSSGLERSGRSLERDGDKSGEKPKTNDGYRYKGPADSSQEKSHHEKAKEKAAAAQAQEEPVAPAEKQKSSIQADESDQGSQVSHDAGIFVSLFSLLQKF